jgi:hypothetical protein
MVVWEWYTKGMTSHRDCTHPATKAARARCRKAKVEFAEMMRQQAIEERIYYETYVLPHELQEKARKEWEAESEKFCQMHMASAEQNADDTAREESFEPYSKRWYEVAISTLHHARDTAERAQNLDWLDNGQMIDIDGKYWWVDRVQYPNEGYYAILIDAEGNRARWNFADLAKYLDS